MNEIKRTFLEFVLIAGAGLVIGLMANAAHPDGLRLSENYFPSSKTTSRPTASAPTAETDPVKRHLIELGLQPISFDQVVATFDDPLYKEQIYIFIDARDDDHYTEGHIPGALQLDQYHIERYIDEVQNYCLAADKIVVYCEGGECEDSEYATLKLRDEYDITAEKLFVYTGGITEWIDKGMVIEIGERDSGKLEGGTHE